MDTHDQTRLPKTLWATDAQQIDISDISDVLYATPEIDAFLNSRHHFFISGKKGYGKSLLLKAKRAYLVLNLPQYGRNGEFADVVECPSARPWVDHMGTPPSLSRNVIKYLGNSENAKRMWSFAIRLTAITYPFPEIFSRLDYYEATEVFEFFPSLKRLKKVSPTEMFRELLSIPVVRLAQLLDSFEPQMNHMFQNLYFKVWCFVDRIDSAFSRMPLQVWNNIQTGLIEAAWEVMLSNRDCRVYATIREEAFENYDSEALADIRSATLRLRYSADQRREIINRLCQIYSQRPDFHAFAGLSTIHNSGSDIEEDCFSYMNRHGSGSPRSLVAMCGELANTEKSPNEETFRRIIEDTSLLLVRNVFAESFVLLDSLNDADERQRFFAILPSNIMTLEEVKNVLREFNGIDDSDFDPLTTDRIYDPFSELYNCGLLGVVDFDFLNDVLSEQKFNRHNEDNSGWKVSLPLAHFYLLHPSLTTLVQRRFSQKFKPIDFVLIGEGLEWRNYFGPAAELKKSLIGQYNQSLKALCESEMGRIIHSLNCNKRTDLEPLFRIRETLDSDQDERLMQWVDGLLAAIELWEARLL